MRILLRAIWFMLIVLVVLLGALCAACGAISDAEANSISVEVSACPDVAPASVELAIQYSQAVLLEEMNASEPANIAAELPNLTALCYYPTGESRSLESNLLLWYSSRGVEPPLHT